MGLPAILAAAGPGFAANVPSLPVVGETIDVRVVNVEAVVTDRRGQLVHGLTAADFQLFVDGKEVAVDYFTEIRDGQSAPAASAPAAAGSANGSPAGASAPASPSSPASPAPQVPPGAEVGRNYLVFVDDGFAVGSTRDAALDRLRASLALLRPEDRMAVVVFDGSRLHALSGWSADKGALAAALRRAADHPPRGNQLLAQMRGMADDEEVASSVPSDGDTSQYAVQARDVFMADLAKRVSPEAATQLDKSAAAAAATLRGFELPAGRRIMLLLTAGWSVTAGPRFYGPLIGAANQLGYTIFPLDVAAGDARSVLLLDQLARITGGRAASATDAAAVGQVVVDSGSYYWLGFTPTGAAGRSRHAIEVKVRRQDLVVRSRHSFSDVSRQTLASMKAENMLLFGAAHPTPAAGERRLKVEAGAPRAAARDKLEVPLTVIVPLAALAVTPQGNGFVADLPLVAASLDDEGGRADLSNHLHLTLAAAPPPDGVARFSSILTLRRIRQRLVFTVSDAQTGDILAAEIEVQPPR